MIFTVFVSESSADEQWQADLMEYSWHRSNQAGELLRLVPGLPHTPLPEHMLARVEPSLYWTNHPYLDDHYAGYNLPAALLEWLTRDQVNATLLVMEPGSVLRQALGQEVTPGQGMANLWAGFPNGDGPFNLPSKYAALQAYCVRRDLKLPHIQLPLLIHSTDLVHVCARWLELIGIIRSTPDLRNEPPSHALTIALSIALAEHDLPIEATDLSEHVIAAENGGQEFLDYCDQFEAARATGEHLSTLRPIKRPGVRQARVLDQWYLELGSPPGMMKLNVSAGAIWRLCDGTHTLQDIVKTLSDSYQVPLENMVRDVTHASKTLRAQGAIVLETLS